MDREGLSLGLTSLFHTLYFDSPAVIWFFGVTLERPQPVPYDLSTIRRVRYTHAKSKRNFHNDLMRWMLTEEYVRLKAMAQFAHGPSVNEALPL